MAHPFDLNRGLWPDRWPARQTRIVPYVPDHIERRMDLAIPLFGDDIPLNEEFVHVVGVFDDSTRSLRVDHWFPLPANDSAWGDGGS